MKFVQFRNKDANPENKFKITYRKFLVENKLEIKQANTLTDHRGKDISVLKISGGIGCNI